jgi:hypothetical protein
MTDCTRSTCGHKRVHHLAGQSCIMTHCPCTQFIDRSFDEPDLVTVRRDDLAHLVQTFVEYGAAEAEDGPILDRLATACGAWIDEVS